MRHRHTCCSLLNQIVIDSVDPWQRLMETKQAESEMRKESDKSKKRSEAREAERLHAAAAAFAATNVKTYVVDRDTHTQRERESVCTHWWSYTFRHRDEPPPEATLLQTENRPTLSFSFGKPMSGVVCQANSHTTRSDTLLLLLLMLLLLMMLLRLQGAKRKGNFTAFNTLKKPKM
jgi:hypothetical protein